MTRFRSILAKTVLLAAAGIGLSACVAVAPEPAPYYAQSYYYQPGYYQPGYYYAPRPAYNSFSFYYSDRDRDDRRGHRSRHWR